MLGVAVLAQSGKLGQYTLFVSLDLYAQHILGNSYSTSPSCLLRSLSFVFLSYTGKHLH